MPADVQAPHLLLGDLLAFLVEFGVEFCSDGQSARRACAREVVECDLVGPKRHSLPVLADLAEEAVLDGVPLGGAGGIVTDGDAQAMSIAELLLQITLEDPAARAICTTGVGEDEQLACSGVVLLPAALDGIHGESGGLAGGAEHDGAGVAAQVIDAIGQRDALGIGEEVVIVDFRGLSPPGPAGILEVADQLPLFAIDADDGEVCGLEAATLGVDRLELAIAARTIAGFSPESRFDVLAVRLERELHLAQ